MIETEGVHAAEFLGTDFREARYWRRPAFGPESASRRCCKGCGIPCIRRCRLGHRPDTSDFRRKYLIRRCDTFKSSATIKYNYEHNKSHTRSHTTSPPRSPRVKLGGYASSLPSVIDKGRAVIAAGNWGEYHFEGKGLDRAISSALSASTTNRSRMKSRKGSAMESCSRGFKPTRKIRASLGKSPPGANITRVAGPMATPRRRPILPHMKQWQNSVRPAKKTSIRGLTWSIWTTIALLAEKRERRRNCCVVRRDKKRRHQH